MDASYRTERIESWVGDFCHSDALGRHAATLQEYAADVLQTFLAAASAERDVDPADVEESDVRAALLGPVARLDLPASQREGVPALVASFLEELEASGRLGGGRSLGAFVRALRPAFLEAASGKTRPIVNPAAKVGRNDPCPCGSGLKYKRCCMGRLGT